MNKDIIKQLLQFVREHKDLLILLLQLLRDCDRQQPEGAA